MQFPMKAIHLKGLSSLLALLQVLAGAFLLWQSWGLSTWRDTDWNEFKDSPDASWNHAKLEEGTTVGLVIVLSFFAIALALYASTRRKRTQALGRHVMLLVLANIIIPLVVLVGGWAGGFLPPR